jgi:hypothetical protein
VHVQAWLLCHLTSQNVVSLVYESFRLSLLTKLQIACLKGTLSLRSWLSVYKKQQKTNSASELYRLSDRHLTKFSATKVGTKCRQVAGAQSVYFARSLVCFVDVLFSDVIFSTVGIGSMINTCVSINDRLRGLFHRLTCRHKITATSPVSMKIGTSIHERLRQPRRCLCTSVHQFPRGRR